MFFMPFGLVFQVMVFLVAGFIAFTIIRGIGEWNSNNQSPRLEVEAEVVAKRTSVTHHHDANNAAMTHTDTTYFVTFEVSSGDRMEFHVSGREYGMLAEGDFGILRFQGTRFLEFERE